jgi:hypothetical protein
MGKSSERKMGWYWTRSFQDGTTDLYAGPFHSRTYAWTKGRVIATMPSGAEIVFLKSSEVSAPGIIDRRKEYARAKK